MTEEWRAVRGWNGYEVSSIGRVRSWRKRGIDTSFKAEPHLLNPSPDEDGYLRGAFYDREQKKNVRYNVHRLVLEAFVGPRPSPMHVCAHGDGNRQNNIVSNLRWATPRENADDCVRHGNSLFGERNTKAKLTEEMVREIRRRPKERRATLAQTYGVSLPTIDHIRGKKLWKHLVQSY